MCSRARSLIAVFAVMAFGGMPDNAGAQMRSFERGDQGRLFVVLTGPGLLSSFGTWAFFPYTLMAPGDFISGSIRTFAPDAGSSADNRGLSSFRKNELTLVSVSNPSRMSSVFPEPRDDETKRPASADATILTPLPVSMSQLLNGSKVCKFRLERLSNSEFLFSLEDKSVRILEPNGHNFWGVTVSLGGNVWISLD